MWYKRFKEDLEDANDDQTIHESIKKMILDYRLIVTKRLLMILADHSAHEKQLTTFNNDPDLIKKVRTVKESWVYGFDLETKAKSSQ